MKIKRMILFLSLLPCLSRANPVDATPIAEFSELAFDAEGRWTIELFLPFGFMEEIPDSIVLRAAGGRSLFKTAGRVEGMILVITADSLEESVPIRREGDTLEITTFSSIVRDPPWPDIRRIKKDVLIFGDRPGASVGEPADGYSILRSRFEANMNAVTVDCLTRIPSLGEENKLTGLDATLKGTLYDSGNEPVTGLKKETSGGYTGVSPYYLELETPIQLSDDGSFTTKLYRRFERERFDQLSVKIPDFEGYSDTTRIDPFEVINIHPDTEFVQDIHLKTDRFTDSVRDRPEFPEDDGLTLINYPNPFNGATHFFIALPGGKRPRNGRILILDTKGRSVRELPVEGGSRASWDGHDRNGFNAPSGSYFYRFVIGNRTFKTGSMLLLR
jgi:hypothetical protein